MNKGRTKKLWERVRKRGRERTDSERESEVEKGEREVKKGQTAREREREVEKGQGEVEKGQREREREREREVEKREREAREREIEIKRIEKERYSVILYLAPTQTRNPKNPHPTESALLSLFKHLNIMWIHWCWGVVSMVWCEIPTVIFFISTQI